MGSERCGTRWASAECFPRMRGAAVELINGRGGTRGTEIIFMGWNRQMNLCVRAHTHTHTHTQNKNTLVPDSRVMACNYFLNGRPCVYQNVNVCIITGSTKPARMSRLPARQSGLKIEWQISMHCCHAALKLTNIRPVHRVELLYHGA